MKDELAGKTMKEFVAPMPRMYSYLMDNGNIDKKAKGTNDCKNSLEYDQAILRT